MVSLTVVFIGNSSSTSGSGWGGEETWKHVWSSIFTELVGDFGFLMRLFWGGLVPFHVPVKFIHPVEHDTRQPWIALLGMLVAQT